MFASRYKDKSCPKVRVKRKMNYFFMGIKREPSNQGKLSLNYLKSVDYLFKA